MLVVVAGVGLVVVVVVLVAADGVCESGRMGGGIAGLYPGGGVLRSIKSSVLLLLIEKKLPSLIVRGVLLSGVIIAGVLWLGVVVLMQGGGGL